MEARCAAERVQASTSEHWEQGDGGAPGPKPGFFSFQPTSVPWVPLPVLKQGMLLTALCLGTLGLLPKPVPGPSPLVPLGASCFGDRPSRSREFTANPHPGLSMGSASREVRGRPRPSWMEGPLAITTLGGGGEPGHTDHESPVSVGSVGEARSKWHWGLMGQEWQANKMQLRFSSFSGNGGVGRGPPPF